MKKKITVAEIAEEANVSAATVSRVLNHRYQVKDSTIVKVESAMLALGYPVEAKAAHPTGELRLLVMNIPDFANTFYHEVIHGAQTSAKARGYQLMVHESAIDQGSIQNYCRMLEQMNTMGALLLNPAGKSVLDQINAVVPLVQCCEYTEHAGYPYVTINDYEAAVTATDHLIGCSRDKIAFINGPMVYKYAQQRQEGFVSALKRAGVTVQENWLVQLPAIDFEMAFTSVCRLLNSENRPNAFFVASDILAAAVIRATNRFGLHVPKDIMVVGFDNIELSQMTTPSITTMKQPSFQLGYSACELLIDSIEHPDIAQKPLILDAELVVRESTLTI